MKMTLIVMILGIFLLIPVSAIYGGETYSIEIEFEPVACSVTDDLSYDIIGNNVEVDLPINFLGNFTLTCFSGEEASPVIVYRGGGSRTKYIYENVTEYVDKIIEVEKIVEVEVPGESKILEKIIEVSDFRYGSNIIVGFLLLIILGLILWNFKRSEKERDFEDYNYRIKKGGENKNE